MKIFLTLFAFFFTSFLNCEEIIVDLNKMVTEETLKKSLNFIFPVLSRKTPPYKLPDMNEYSDLFFEFKSLTPDIFRFKFDEDGILNVELNVQVNFNGTMDYYLNNVLIKRKFTFNLRNIIIQSKIKLNVTKNDYEQYDIKYEFIDKNQAMATRITFLDDYGDIEELKKIVDSKVLSPFSYKYLRSYHEKVFGLVIHYTQFIINNYP